jgi:hypothetical protein
VPSFMETFHSTQDLPVGCEPREAHRMLACPPSMMLAI